MSIVDLLPKLRLLSRTDRLRLIQVLAQELAEDDPAALIEQDREYHVWSPHDSYEAAATLLRVLDEEKRTP